MLKKIFSILLLCFALAFVSNSQAEATDWRYTGVGTTYIDYDSLVGDEEEFGVILKVNETGDIYQSFWVANDSFVIVDIKGQGRTIANGVFLKIYRFCCQYLPKWYR